MAGVTTDCRTGRCCSLKKNFGNLNGGFGNLNMNVGFGNGNVVGNNVGNKNILNGLLLIFSCRFASKIRQTPAPYPTGHSLLQLKCSSVVKPTNRLQWVISWRSVTPSVRFLICCHPAFLQTFCYALLPRFFLVGVWYLYLDIRTCGGWL
jgi:hypothetical protein